MTTWTTIPNASVAVGGIPSSTTVTALRDNPSAIAESSSGAPVMVSGWHPVDKVTVGDGKTGLIYDVAVNGIVASVTTPDFEDGYEYRIVARDVSHNDTTASRSLQIYGYFETTAAFRLMIDSAADSSADSFGCDVEFLLPRIPSRGHMLRSTTYASTAFRNGKDQNTTSWSSTNEKLLRARVQFAGGSIDAGKIWFFRRREYASSP